MTFISGCQSQMTGRHFQSRCERSHPTLSFASDPTIPSNIEKNPSTISQCSRDCLCFAARFLWKKVNTHVIPDAFQTLRFFCSWRVAKANWLNSGHQIEDMLHHFLSHFHFHSRPVRGGSKSGSALTGYSHSVLSSTSYPPRLLLARITSSPLDLIMESL